MIVASIILGVSLIIAAAVMADGWVRATHIARGDDK